jgi:peroxiredoxin
VAEASDASRPEFTHRRPKHGLVGPFGGRQLLAALLVVVAVVVLLTAATAPLGSTATPGPRNPRATPYVLGPAPAEGLHVGDQAPELSVVRADGSTFTLIDLQGHPLSLAAMRGHPVWINFWASWCPPCQSETPNLRETYAAHRADGLVLIAISVQETNAADVGAYVAKYSLPYTVAADLSADIFHRYRVYALPTQFFIDASGVIRSVVQGPLDRAGAEAHLADILPAAATSSGGPSPSAR